MPLTDDVNDSQAAQWAVAHNAREIGNKTLFDIDGLNNWSILLFIIRGLEEDNMPQEAVGWSNLAKCFAGTSSPVQDVIAQN